MIDLELDDEANKTKTDYVCPIFLHRDESNAARYFVTHNNGVHSVNVPSIHELQKFVNSKNADESLVDAFKESTTIEHLICSKNEATDETNTIVGFSLYYEPASVVALLSNGELVSLALLSSSLLPPLDSLDVCDAEDLQSPLKKVCNAIFLLLIQCYLLLLQMLREPFDAYLQKILKQATTQPILKLPSNSDANQQQCLEVITKKTTTK